MLNRENPKIQELLKMGEPHSRSWPNYVVDLKLVEDDVDDLIKLVTDEVINQAPSNSTQVWAPLHAWRSLGQLKTPKAIDPLIQCFDFFCKDGAALTELPIVFGFIGGPAIAPLTNYFAQEVEDEFCHVLAIDALTKIAETNADLRLEVLSIFKRYMQNPQRESYVLNGLLMGDLIDLKAVELIDDIRHLFNLDCVDWSSAGDLEEVEILLGLRTKRSTKKPHLYDSQRGLNEHMMDSDESEIEMDSFDRDLYQSNMPNAFVRQGPKVGRNDPCPCQSGKKFKKCCGKNGD